MASKFFGNQRACRIYTAGCVSKMEVSVTGPRAVNELGGPVIPGKQPSRNLNLNLNKYIEKNYMCLSSYLRTKIITESI